MMRLYSHTRICHLRRFELNIRWRIDVNSAGINTYNHSLD